MTEVEKILDEYYGDIVEEEIVTRKNDFCVISKESNKYGWHDLQTNSAWSCNPYGDDYAIVPDEMVEAIMETCGYCDIVLNEDETEVVSFTPTEITVFPEPEPQPTQLDIIEAQVTYTALMTDTLLGVN